jgi:hypothetical protein
MTSCQRYCVLSVTCSARRAAPLYRGYSLIRYVTRVCRQMSQTAQAYCAP